ncbi:hypothetical protein SELMODRAFT_130316 [Selaginella moellendorffii]|uniref:Rieske domain-containing protein n=1 Tax=Selaginella moellendorffii TaxID=88036 RepID=D8T2F9_SELML|nr:hypothetical protein SELMODRAFT_130316 [Selaginella moellendorffii]
MAILEVLAPDITWQSPWKSLWATSNHSVPLAFSRRTTRKGRVAHPRHIAVVTRATSSREKEEALEQTKRSTWFDWNSEWYPVAIEQELDKGVPHAVTILGNELVVWWDRNGKNWQVFSDKCPHRLAPLSEGRIAENGHIQCSYHGWMFAPGTGSCSRIPQAQPGDLSVRLSPRACATVYPSMEQQGILWMNFSASASSQIKPPFFPVLEDADFVHYWATSDVPYGYEALIENLMDPTHVPFAHHKLQGNRNKTGPVSYTVNKFDRHGFKGSTGRGDVVFMPPLSFVMEIRIPPKQKVLSKLSSKLEESDKITYTVFMCVPVLPGRSKAFWSFPRNFAKSIHFYTPRWLAHLRHMLVLDSDLYLLHIMEQKQERNEREFTPTSADAFVLGFRRWLSVYAGGAPGYAPHIDRKLPSSPPKPQLMDRYENHVKRCPTCMAALRSFKLAELGLQIAAIATVAVASIRRSWWGILGVFLWIASRYTARFIRKNYHFHDYNHALVK